MIIRVSSFFVMRRRLVKAYLKFTGWKFRGQDPPSKWRHIMLISPAIGEVLKSQKKWMRYLTATPSQWVTVGESDKIKSLLIKKHTVLIRWDKSWGDLRTLEANSEITLLLQSARKHKVRVSACAWDTSRKAIKFHSQFRPSHYSERDVRYLGRFFKYFEQI